MGPDARCRRRTVGGSRSTLSGDSQRLGSDVGIILEFCRQNSGGQYLITITQFPRTPRPLHCPGSSRESHSPLPFIDMNGCICFSPVTATPLSQRLAIVMFASHFIAVLFLECGAATGARRYPRPSDRILRETSYRIGCIARIRRTDSRDYAPQKGRFAKRCSLPKSVLKQSCRLRGLSRVPCGVCFRERRGFRLFA
jgi:hypothetical protein